jgi:hypothetical protein
MLSLPCARGRVFTRDRLLDAVWKGTAFVTPRSVDVLRQAHTGKISKAPGKFSLVPSFRRMRDALSFNTSCTLANKAADTRGSKPPRTSMSHSGTTMRPV